MPVPSSSLPPDFTSIDTTAGMTLSTSWGMVTFPLSTAAPGDALLSWIVTPVPPLLPLWSAMAVTAAPTTPPMSAATRAIGSQVRNRPEVPPVAPGPARRLGSGGGG